MTAPVITAPRDLISPRLFTRLTCRIMTDNRTDQATADRIMEQALAFLYACALNPGLALAPSEPVDAGWHTFILHTADYAEFCERIAGRFIHHLPAEPGEGDDGGESVRAAKTVMRAAGMPADETLWPSAADCSNEKCHQCHAGCYDSPKRA